jgi:hypothetical protein
VGYYRQRGSEEAQLSVVALRSYWDGDEVGGWDFVVLEGDSFGEEETAFFGEAGGEAGEVAGGADDAVTGDGGGVGVFVEGVADSAVGAGV